MEMEYLGIHLLVKRRDTTITSVERRFETRITLLNIIMLVYVRLFLREVFVLTWYNGTLLLL